MLKKHAKPKGFKQSMPTKVQPMLCQLARSIPADKGYLYEIKWDGYRLIAHISKGGVRLDSRSGLDYSRKYPLLVNALSKLKKSAILDGEAVVLNNEGKPDFDALQRYNGHDTPIYYFVFDIIWLDGYSLVDLPLTERKKILKRLTNGNEVIRYSEGFDDGEDLFQQALEMSLEGIVAKKKESTYRQGQRGSDWIKIPTEIRQEFVIGGWVESERGRPFASLLFGAYNKGKFEWIGHAGGGFKHAEMGVILKKLKSIEVKRSPFKNRVDADGIVHWVKPKLVANFKFATWTSSGKIRKPAIFLGFRKDKMPGQVVREVPRELNSISKEKNEKAGRPQKLPKLSAGSNWKKIESEKITSSAEFELENCSITITNVEKKLWPGTTKADLIKYYHEMAPLILPQIRDRPQSLHVKPVNATAPGFYIKDMEGRQPACAKIFSDKRRHKAKGKRDVIDYLVCNNLETLLFMVNLGCIDINPWNSRITSPSQPDFIIIDLDPSDDDFNKVIETAMAARQYFKEKKLTAFPKTSGKTGIHLYLPCAGIDFVQARDIAENVCKSIHQLVPSITTTAVSIASRGNKLYLDPNQNDYADTVAAAYTVRPFKLPLVSTPLEWKEIKRGLSPEAFTIMTIMKRIKKKGEIFNGVMDQQKRTGNTRILLQQLGVWG